MNNPIFAFSAIRRMRSVRTPLLITLYSLLLAALAYFTVYGRFMGATVTLGDMRLSVDGYAYMIMLQFGMLVLVAPAMTAGSISGERERQTLDLLLVTNTGPVKLQLSGPAGDVLPADAVAGADYRRSDACAGAY